MSEGKEACLPPADDHQRAHNCISATETNIPPFIIYPRCLPSVTYALHGTRDSLYDYSERGYMTIELLLMAGPFCEACPSRKTSLVNHGPA